MDGIRAKTIKLLEENTGENLYGLELGKDFLDTIRKVTEIRLVISSFEMWRREYGLQKYTCDFCGKC